MNATKTTSVKQTAKSTVRDIMKWFGNDPTHLKIHPSEPDPCEKIYKRMAEANAYSVFRLSLQTHRNIDVNDQ